MPSLAPSLTRPHHHGLDLLIFRLCPDSLNASRVGAARQGEGRGAALNPQRAGDIRVGSWVGRRWLPGPSISAVALA